MSQQIFTLIGTVVGAAVGLLAPMISSSQGRRQRDRDVQRQLADDIMTLFEAGDPLESWMTGVRSGPRRRLYLLALRLESSAARDACLRFVAQAGGEKPDAAGLLDAWDGMVNEVGAVYRRNHRGRR